MFTLFSKISHCKNYSNQWLLLLFSTELLHMWYFLHVRLLLHSAEDCWYFCLFVCLFQSKSSHLNVFSLLWWKKSVWVHCNNSAEGLKPQATGMKHLRRWKGFCILIKVMGISFPVGVNTLCLANENSVSQIHDHLNSSECRYETKIKDCESNANKWEMLPFQKLK